MSSAEERDIRAAFLQSLRQADVSGAGTVSPAEFQAALNGLGLRFGNPIVDRIMLQCKITPDGKVCFDVLSHLLKIFGIFNTGVGRIQLDERALWISWLICCLAR